MSTKTKFAAVALAALTLGSAVLATSEAQARPRWGGAALGVGIVAGLIGAAAASNAYAAPAPAYGYYDRPLYRH